jgi:hypothetical protein
VASWSPIRLTANGVSDGRAWPTFYPLLGSALKRRFAGWNCYLLSADTRLPKLIRLTPSKKTPLFNGALECRLYEFKMVAGSNRAVKVAPAPPDPSPANGRGEVPESLARLS